MKKFSLKTPEEIQIMAEGGKRLAAVRDALAAAVKPGMTSLQLDTLANDLLRAAGGKASFAMVPGYKHATCINVGDVVVHGIPDGYIFKPGDKVGIDVGLFYEGFHTDTATTVLVPGADGRTTKKTEAFLEVGRKTLKKAVSEAKIGKRVADISKAMQEGVEGAGYSVVRALTGHGVGKQLHEEPAIPCFVLGAYEHSPKLVEGMVIAIEIMYNEGEDEVAYKNDDGWTIVTADGTISGLFEETVAITKRGPLILTKTTR